MKFYRVSQSHEHGASAGSDWFTNKQDADGAAGKWRKESDHHAATVEAVDIEPTKAGILDALRRYATHPDNG